MKNAETRDKINIYWDIIYLYVFTLCYLSRLQKSEVRIVRGKPDYIFLVYIPAGYLAFVEPYGVLPILASMFMFALSYLPNFVKCIQGSNLNTLENGRVSIFTTNPDLTSALVASILACVAKSVKI